MSIEQIGFGLSASAGYPGSVVTANTIATPTTLAAGTPYRLVLAPHDAYSFQSSGVWNPSTQGISSSKIDGDRTWTGAVPEPSSYLLIGGGIAGSIAMKRLPRPASI